MAGNPNWTKGVSGNPKGKPKGPNIADTLRKFGDMAAPEELLAKLRAKWPELGTRKLTMFQAECVRQHLEAAGGDVKAFQAILDRVCGKVPTPVGITGDNSLQITVNEKYLPKIPDGS